MVISRSDRVSVSKNWRAALTGKRTTSAMDRPAILTESVSGRSREPAQVGQSRSVMKSSTSRRVSSDAVSL
jgi:hypothetical protein